MSQPYDEAAEDAEDVAFHAAWSATDDGRRYTLDQLRALMGPDPAEPLDEDPASP